MNTENKVTMAKITYQKKKEEHPCPARFFCGTTLTFMIPHEKYTCLYNSNTPSHRL
jgi:hypothetical protein